MIHCPQSNHISMKQFLIIFTCFICFLLLSAEKAPTGKIAYSSGKLQGRKLSDLYAVYLGFDSHKTVKVESKIKVNFAKAYTEMWQCKQDQCPSKVAAQAGETLVAEYTKKHTSITFTAYTDHISVVVKGLKKSINWAKVADLTNIKPGDTTLVKNIVNSFSGKDMSAYILTELMPSADGSLNVTMLDFLLRNAGREYIEGIPALHDGKTSFGPYQFTEYAIFGKEDAERGASVINQAVSGKQKIPGSVI